MTNRIASLRQAALHVRIATFQSLSWEARLAHVIKEVFGAGKRKVPEEVDYGPILIAKALDVTLNDAAKAHKVGFDFTGMGAAIYKAFIGQATRRMKSESLGKSALSDAMSTTALHFSKNFDELKLDIPRPAVLSFLRGGVAARLKDSYKKYDIVSEREKSIESLQEQNSLFDTDLQEVDVEDPDSLKPFKALLDDDRELYRVLDAVVPWASGWYKMVKQGYEDVEIIGDYPHQPSQLAQRLGIGDWLPTNNPNKVMTMGSWSKSETGYKAKLRKALKEYLTQEKDEYIRDQAEDLGLDDADIHRLFSAADKFKSAK